MYLDIYFEKIDKILHAIQTTQRHAIEQAGQLIAKSLKQGGVVSVMDTGHMLKHEAFMRAGGLVAFTPYAYSLQIEHPVDWRQQFLSAEKQTQNQIRLAQLALESSKLKKEDILIINSNSGRTTNVVETALCCQKKGIITIAICSSEQMNVCEPVHPTGKKLADIVDVFVDNCTPAGDAIVAVKKNEKMCPGSGIASAYIFWAIQAVAVEHLQKMGLNPTIYRSIHLGGPKYLEKQKKKFLKHGL